MLSNSISEIPLELPRIPVANSPVLRNKSGHSFVTSASHLTDRGQLSC